MSRVSRRAARAETRVEAATGGTRVRNRPRGVSAPDLLPLRTPAGEVLQFEVKSSKRPPKKVLDAIQQARRYCPDAIPVAAFVPFGGGAFVALPLDDFCRLLGLQAPKPGQQFALLGGRS